MSKSFFSLSLIALMLAGCNSDKTRDKTLAHMTPIAESYVRTALALGEIDKAYVDAYYGPPEWRKQAESEKRSLDQIRQEAESLLARLGQIPTEQMDEPMRLRHQYLSKQLHALRTRVEILQGKKLSFDEEAKALYDAAPPTRPEDHFRQVRDRLAAKLPGRGSVPERYEQFRKQFVIPPDKLDVVFRRAIEACKERTQKHIQLPAGETFKLEYVKDKSWSGYNWYQGGFHSLIQVNTDLPIYIDRAVDLACHEGYPGHHVYNLLLEKTLVKERGWVEFSIYPLYSPQSLIAEGSANYGIDMAFPGAERVEFEKKELFPLAGLDAARADEYYEVTEMAEQLSYATNEAARRYLNGEINAEQTAKWLNEYALQAPDRAKQYVRFIDEYRSYVINYNLGKDMVRAHIEAVAGDDQHKRWIEFEKLLSSPRLPSGLSGSAKPQ